MDFHKFSLFFWSYTRLLSLALRDNIDKELIVVEVTDS